MYRKTNIETGRFTNMYEHLLTKEILLESYKELKTLKLVGKKFNVSGDCVKKYMNLHNISYIKKTKYECNEDFFECNNEKSFYWAGFMAADGNVSKKGDINIGVSIKDINHLEKFKNDIKSNAPIKIITKKSRIINGITTPESKFATFRFRSKKMVKDLQRFNVIPNKTNTYFIPDQILNHDLNWHFIRGYFDGDGWFTKRKYKNYFRISIGFCGTKMLIENIKKIFSNYHGACWQQKNIFKLEFNKQGIYNKQIAGFMYDQAEIFLDRKFNIYQEIVNLPFI